MSSNIIVGRWWRFTDYEVRDGYIRPAPGSELNVYDPFEEFERAGHARREHGQRPPYQSLLNLSLEFEGGEAGRSQDAVNLWLSKPGDKKLTSKSERSVSEWCRSYGLLGLLPHSCLWAAMPPRWALPEPFTLLDQIVYVRLRGRWGKQTQLWDEEDLQRIFDRGLQGERQEEEWLFPPLQPSALFHHLSPPMVAYEPLSFTWARFFPDIPNDLPATASYPQPLSEDFWKQYAEPVEMFVAAVRVFQDMVACLQRNQPAKGHTKRDQDPVLAGAGALQRLLAVSPVLVPAARRKFTLKWYGESLLAMLALMLALDLAGGKRVRECPKCYCHFLTKKYNAAYCSVRCRAATQKARQRARKKKRRMPSSARVQSCGTTGRSGSGHKEKAL